MKISETFWNKTKDLQTQNKWSSLDPKKTSWTLGDIAFVR